MALLDLDPDQLLSTTRAVRKRLDFDKPVPDDLIRECVAMALQAPSGSNTLTMSFVVVARPRQAQSGRRGSTARRSTSTERHRPSPGSSRATRRTRRPNRRGSPSSADFLAATHGRGAGARHRVQRRSPTEAGGRRHMGNVLPAMWSFMLAARARGLGTAWTTLHLMKEQRGRRRARHPVRQRRAAGASPGRVHEGHRFQARRCGPIPTRSSTGTPGNRARMAVGRPGGQGLHAARRRASRCTTRP